MATEHNFSRGLTESEYERGKKDQVKAGELDEEGGLYLLRQLAGERPDGKPKEKAIGPYAVETLVSVETVEEAGECYVVTFRWTNLEALAKEPEVVRSITVDGQIFISVAKRKLLKRIMEKREFGYFLDQEEDWEDDLNDLPEVRRRPNQPVAA